MSRTWAGVAASPTACTYVVSCAQSLHGVMARPPQELAHHHGLDGGCTPAPAPACNDDEALLRQAAADCVLALQLGDLAMQRLQREKLPLPTIMVRV